MEKHLEQRIVFGAKTLHIILAKRSENDKQSAQRKFELSCLFIDQISQGFPNKNTTIKNNSSLYWLML